MRHGAASVINVFIFLPTFLAGVGCYCAALQDISAFADVWWVSSPERLRTGHHICGGMVWKSNISIPWWWSWLQPLQLHLEHIPEKKFLLRFFHPLFLWYMLQQYTGPSQPCPVAGELFTLLSSLSCRSHLPLLINTGMTLYNFGKSQRISPITNPCFLFLRAVHWTYLGGRVVCRREDRVARVIWVCSDQYRTPLVTEAPPAELHLASHTSHWLPWKRLPTTISNVLRQQCLTQYYLLLAVGCGLPITTSWQA